jgi:cytosine/adenosine deaminase-related metal-dependent hydrolase
MMGKGVATNSGTIVECSHLVVSPTKVLENAAIAFRDGVVVATGPREEVISQYPDFARIGSSQHTIVMPGLVNSHHHGFGLSTVQFGYRDDYLETWLIDLISMPPVDPFLDTLWSAMRQVRSGVTTVQHSAFVRSPVRFGEEVEDALRAYSELGVRALLAIQARDQNSYVYQDDDAFLDSVPAEVAAKVRAAESKLPWPSWDEIKQVVLHHASELAENPMLGVQICAEGPEWCSEDLLVDIAATARANDLRVHMHCLETPFQPDYMRELYGTDAISKLKEIGFLGPHLSLAHAAWITTEQLDICAAEGVTLCHCPSSNLRLRNGIFPLEAAHRAGVSVGLGLDSNTINDNDDMLQEMRLALRLHRMPQHPELSWAPTAEDILTLATSGGAAAVGRSGELGSLDAGMAADLVMLDGQKLLFPYASGDVSIGEHIVGRATPDVITDVIIAGEHVLAGGEFANVDEAQVGRELAASVRQPIPSEQQEWRDAMVALHPHVRDFYARWGTAR